MLLVRLPALIKVDLEGVCLGGQFVPVSAKLLDLCSESLLKLRLGRLRVLLQLSDVQLETLLGSHGRGQLLLAGRDALLQLADLILTALLQGISGSICLTKRRSSLLLLRLGVPLQLLVITIELHMGSL